MPLSRHLVSSWPGHTYGWDFLHFHTTFTCGDYNHSSAGNYSRKTFYGVQRTAYSKLRVTSSFNKTIVHEDETTLSLRHHSEFRDLYFFLFYNRLGVCDTSGRSVHVLGFFF